MIEVKEQGTRDKGQVITSSRLSSADVACGYRNIGRDSCSAAFKAAALFSAAVIVMSLMATPAQAADSRVEAAVKWAIEIANDPIHGYSQGAENATPSRPYTGSREGPDYDCASLVYHAFQQAGFDIIGAWHKNPEYTARYNGRQYSGDADTIWDDLKTLGGWQKFSWAEVADNLQRGDILCRPQFHVAIYKGDGLTVEARGVNNPTGMGRYETGDQGGEIDFYDAYGRGWTEVYRYVGE